MTVKRKILVLDLDETLIHSHHDGVLRQTVKPGTPSDFTIRVFVFNKKCFHLNLNYRWLSIDILWNSRFTNVHMSTIFCQLSVNGSLLNIITKIYGNCFRYELVVFTASMEVYGTSVADRLDRGRGILKRRLVVFIFPRCLIAQFLKSCTPSKSTVISKLLLIIVFFFEKQIKKHSNIN